MLRACPRCAPTYGGLADRRCPFCAGAATVRLGEALVAAHGALVVSRAVEMYLGEYLEHMPAEQAAAKADVLIEHGFIEPPAAPTGEPWLNPATGPARQTIGRQAVQLLDAAHLRAHRPPKLADPRSARQRAQALRAKRALGPDGRPILRVMRS